MSQTDAGLGVGVTWVFGQGLAVGVKNFTNDDENKGIGSVGMTM
ncbi:hypothetical protein [Neptunomonas antarctica]|uniref:Uncharacterized protein n=1 Tax=Neptunomonas antarctica TaxID=619304 RepID=A0A1N7NDS9_9GAMM|nr:hypothetical protein [Neptunomonas antarctica]SIS96517.1 hypothetical protein SAMN05421760_10941 [Neptunomonas antarctica]